MVVGQMNRPSFHVQRLPQRLLEDFIRHGLRSCCLGDRRRGGDPTIHSGGSRLNIENLGNLVIKCKGKLWEITLYKSSKNQKFLDELWGIIGNLLIKCPYCGTSRL